jgi:two-component sensor histidine kinase
MKTDLLLLLALSFLWQSCNRFDLKKYDFSALPAQTEQRLSLLSDTVATQQRLEELASRKQVDSLIFFAEWLKNYDEKAALHYAQKAYDISTSKNWNIPRAISAYRLAWSKGKKAQFGEDIEDAIVEAKISKRLLEAYDEEYWQMEMHYLFGFLFQKDGQLDSARYHYQQALGQLHSIDEPSPASQVEEANLLVNLAATYPFHDTLNKMLLFRKSDSLYQRLHNEKDRARLWYDQAIFYKYHKQFDQADSLLERCIDYARSKPDYDLMALAYQQAGHLYQQKFRQSESPEDFALAISYLNKSLNFTRDYHYWTYEIIGSAYQDSWAAYIDDAHIDSALYYKKLAFTAARQQGAIKTMKSTSGDLAYLSGILGESHEAILGASLSSFLDQNYAAVSDSITQNARSAFKRINEVEQRDIIINAASKRKNQLFIGLIIFFFSAAGFIFFMLRAQNKRLKAEMNALRAQINPHFISNSLNAIENLVNGGQTRAASKYLVHFSRLSRQILTGSRNTTTSLSAELKMLEHFLALEQLRFQDKLTYEIRVAPNVETSTIVVPAIVIQPYVENAIWHGIKPKPEGGHVTIDIQKEKKTLICIIEDNGIGRKESQRLKQSSVLKHKSMGMKITEERIKAMGRIKGSHVEIIDLEGPNGAALGTRVILKLALIYTSISTPNKNLPKNV